VVDHLSRSIGNAEASLDKDFRDPIDDDDGGRNPRQQGVTTEPVQRAATRTTLTVRLCPSMRSVSVEAPSGAPPRATATANVSVAM
jgi:hypothetical protein